MYQHRKRDLKYWQDKDNASWQKCALIKSEIMQLEFYIKCVPQRRYPGKDRTLQRRYYDIESSDDILLKVKYVRSNRRVFAFRCHAHWADANKRWRSRVTRLASARKRLKMMQETKIPYYRERIKALGGKSMWE